MRTDRPISDHTITVVCYTIGGLSLIISLFCLAFARRLQPSATRGVFAILVLLQVLYTVHNFHFSVLFLPFLYIEVGGGYCIGVLCEPHYVSFTTNVIILMFLTGYLRSMFFLLVFVRHQRLLDVCSPLKLGKVGKALFGFSIIVGGNILPLKYMSLHIKASAHAMNLTLENFFHTVDWIERHRNFVVFPKEDGDILMHITAFISASYSAFAVVCSIHIVKIIYMHNQSQSSRTWATTIKQTRQSMILVANFVAFISVPIALMVNLPTHHLDDDSIVLLPCIFLCSLSSASHSLLTLFHSPLFRPRKRSNSIELVR